MREHQSNYSQIDPSLFDASHRQKKARTAELVLRHHLGGALADASVLDIGSSTGWIGAWMASHVAEVTGSDIDADAIAFSARQHRLGNFRQVCADAMRLPFADERFDLVLCMQMYEHVPDSARLFDEIHRVLRPGGLCYLAADNRWQWMEPHHRLPLLSVLPRAVANRYVRLFGRGDQYYERLESRAALSRLVRRFKVHDYTSTVIARPADFGIDYLLAPGSMRHRLARLVANALPELTPGFIWLLEKREPKSR